MGNVESKRLVLNVGLFSTTVAAVVYYIWFGPKPSPRFCTTGSSLEANWEPTNPSSDGIRGYYNLGNSCYINSLLQALAASRHNVRYISNYFELKQLCCQGDQDNPAFRIVSALATSNQYINRDSGEINVELARQIPRNVIATFKNWSQVSLATHEEQDVHEFFNTIMAAVSEEQKALQARPDFMEAVKNVEDSSLPFSFTVSDSEPSSESGISSPSLDDSGGDGCGIANILTKRAIGTNSGIITKGSISEVPQCPPSPTTLIEWNNPFVGRFASSFQCISCQTTLPIKFEEFTDLTLTLPPKVMPTLKDLIEHYFVPAVVHSVDCPSCSITMNKLTKSAFYKKTCITKFPRSLCIHVNRSEWGVANGCSFKRFEFIPFPIVLDMSMVNGFTDLMKTELPVMLGQGEPQHENRSVPHHRQSVIYKLMAVVCHRGSVDTGHFLAYRLSPPLIAPEEWYLVSDTYIRPVMEEQVLLQHAYMLFYDRAETC